MRHVFKTNDIMTKLGLSYLFVVFAVGMMVSCSSSDKKGGMMSLDGLPVHVIHAEQYNKQELITGTPWEFHRIKDKFFVFNGQSTCASLVFRLSDCFPLGEFMPKGMGPGECLTPRYAGCSPDEDTVYIYDSSKSKMVKFYFPENHTDRLSYSLVEETMSSSDRYHMATCRLANGLTVAFNGSGTRHLFTLYNENQDSIGSFGSLPLPVEDDQLKSFLPFQGIMVTEGNTVYFGCKMLPYLCAYNVESHDKIELIFSHNYLSTPYEYSNRISIDRERNVESFRDIKVNGDYICTTFMGCSGKSIDANPYDGFARTLLVFNKKGEPLAKWEFPNKGSHICFSEDGKILYHFTTDTNIGMVRVEDLWGDIR